MHLSPPNRYQIQRHLRRGQTSDLLHEIILECTNEHSAKPQGNSLQSDILRNMPSFHMHIAHTTLAIPAGCAGINGCQQNGCWRLAHCLLLERGLAECYTLLPERFRDQGMAVWNILIDTCLQAAYFPGDQIGFQRITCSGRGRSPETAGMGDTLGGP